MYSSRGNNAYSQQSYAGQSSYGQNLGSAYPGSSVGGPDVGSQLSMASRHSSIIGSQEASGGGYRTHPSGAVQYGGQYSSVYGSAALSGASQVPAITAKTGISALEGRAGYTSAITDSPKFSSGDYVSSSSHGYSLKADKLYAEKVPDYPVIDRRQYGEQQRAYVGRDIHADPTGRYTDSVGFVSQHQSDIYERIDQAVLLRQEQLLKAQSLQSASLDGSARQADYLAARGASSRHSTQELVSLGGRTDIDNRGLSMLSASSHNGQHAPSILGAAPRRTVDDLMYAQSSSNPGYGVSLPPGRDYAMGKGLHGSSLDEDYQSSLLPRAGHSRIDERKDDKASYLREFELREEERRRERLRVREKDKEREKDHERDRERERERQRILERREKERDRERKRALEIRHGRTPPRVSRDRRGSSSTKEGGRPLRRDSPHRESLHRRHSPVKEKRREYVCKVYTSSVIDVERGYLSIDKRYPRLFISPEFSKVVVNWPKENLKLSIQTPVSFEHDFIEEEGATELKKPSTELLSEERSKGHGNTVWNAKIVLMSGISKNALEELSSEKNYDDRIPHICNILRFAVLKKGHSYMAIGGPWDPADGTDPSIDDSSLIHTAQRYAKDVAKLDLQNCQHWNHFLEIHYDRFGKDGLFSHKEITVVFVPDLSECLPSLDTWRDQWLAFKKAGTERDEFSKKKERLREKEVLKGKEDSLKDVKMVEKKKEPASSGKAKAIDKEKANKGLKGNVVDGKGTADEMKPKEKDVKGTGKLGKNENQVQEKFAGSQTPGSVKAGKKKIVRKVVKQKVAGKIGGTTSKQPNEKEDGEKKNAESDAPNLQAELSVDPSMPKNLKKKVTKKVGTASESKNKDTQLETDIEKCDGSEEKSKDPSDPSLGGVVQDSGVKAAIKKKKIIKRIPKKKVTGTESTNGPSDNKKDGDGKNGVQGNGTENTGKQAADAETILDEVKNTEKKMTSQKKSSKMQVPEMQDNNTELKEETLGKKDAKSLSDRSGSGNREGLDLDKGKPRQNDNLEGKQQKLKDDGKAKDEKERKGKDGKDESRNKSSKDKEKKPEEPPRHPGLILQTRWSKDCQLRSSSLSLDSLLDYSDKDIEESAFELSLFAETLYEMLQYQMGCRILSFLQKLRARFVRKRSQRKRQQEERKDTEIVKASPSKRLKTEVLSVKNQLSQVSEMLSEPQPDNENKNEENNVIEDHNSPEHIDEEMEHETDDEEDPEEDPEEYEEMEDASPQRDSSAENIEEGKSDMNVEPENDPGELDKSVKKQPEMKASEAEANLDVTHGSKGLNMDTSKKETTKEAINDKELLQAFRFFDRNRVGYIRVEDMRLIIHNLGKFPSHRDVKELVQSALLESNTGRDDHILYYKLVRMIDI